MEKKVKKRKYLITLFVLTLVTGIGGALVFNYLFPEYYFSEYPLIPIYFFLFGFIGIYLFERVHRNIQNKTLVLYASIRMMKLMVSIVVLLICGVFFKEHIRELLFTFVLFYIIYMIFEVLFFYQFEKGLKKNKKNNI